MKHSLVVGKEIQQAKKLPMNAPGRGEGRKARRESWAKQGFPVNTLMNTGDVKEYQGSRRGFRSTGTLNALVQLCTVKFKVLVEYSRLYEEVWYSRLSPF